MEFLKEEFKNIFKNKISYIIKVNIAANMVQKCYSENI